MTLALGYRSVGEMLESLSHEEYIRWLAFFSEEGFPQDKDDLQFGTLIAAVMNSSGRWKKRFKPSDFIPDKWVADPAEKSYREQVEADREFGARLMELKSRMVN